MKKHTPPFIAYLWQCHCGGINDIGFLFLTLKEAQKGSCKEATIQKVKIIPYKK